jgi:hypothetical protein
VTRHDPAPGRRTPRWATVLLVLVVLALIAVGLSALQRVSNRLDEVAVPRLSQRVAAAPPFGDVVQDQGNTVTLDGGRTLWIFADTAKTAGRPRFFVTSSAAIAIGDDLRITYLRGRNGHPIEFLPRTAGERADQVQGKHYTAIWPTGATSLPDGRIVIAYAKYAVHFEPTARFDFKAGGLFEYRAPERTANARPATRLADDIWTVADGPVASPLYFQGYVYFYRCEDFSCFSLRTTPARLADKASYQWWNGGGWGVQSGRAKIAFGSDVPGRNPSIAWSSALGVFTMTDTTGGIQDDEGRLWVAKTPWGPWSDAARFPLPECPKQGCYTLNVHPQQSPPGTLRVSFATNGLGPYVRVVDVPVAVDAKKPSIRTGTP